nr:hypothetical protein [uncultured archaeon]
MDDGELEEALREEIKENLPEIIDENLGDVMDVLLDEHFQEVIESLRARGYGGIDTRRTTERAIDVG